MQGVLVPESLMRSARYTMRCHIQNQSKGRPCGALSHSTPSSCLNVIETSRQAVDQNKQVQVSLRCYLSRAVTDAIDATRLCISEDGKDAAIG